MSNTTRPLADIMRPNTIDEVVGQRALLGENGIIRRMVDNKKLSNLLLWGPPGCGKTTIARALANSVDMDFVPMSAVFSGTADIKKTMEVARTNATLGRGTLLFIDEIHRFNKTQQDTLLPYLEDGTVVFIGATTENPSFNLNNALLSRCHIGVLEPLDTADLLTLIERAEKHQRATHGRLLLCSVGLLPAGGPGRGYARKTTLLIRGGSGAFGIPSHGRALPSCGFLRLCR